jgi:hypothetical protein
MSEVRVAFEFAERVEDRIGDHEVQRCQRLTSGAGDDALQDRWSSVCWD